MKFINVYIVLGIICILVGFAGPTLASGLVTLIIPDTTPPIITSTLPANGQTYPTPFTLIQVECNDPESDIASATMKIDTIDHALTHQAGTNLWSAIISNPANGQHMYIATVTNGGGLTTTASGSFAIAWASLGGDWYVNGQKITSPSQTIYASSNQVAFQFKKTSGGAPDNQITCFVVESSRPETTLVTLTYSALYTWTGTYTFTGGKHVLSLVATDSTTPPVTMAVLNLDFGSPPSPLSFSTIMYILGTAFIGYGFYVQKAKHHA